MTHTALAEQLQEPFEPHEVKWKPQAVKNDRALAVAYVDARVVMDRLDDVFGVDGWQKTHSVLPTGLVTCKLRCRIGDEWVEKEDIGDISDQPGEGDKEKSAFSDSLKRAAVCFGIGRYLYRLPMQWVDYDASKRAFCSTPQLPTWALPKKQQPAQAPAKTTPPTGNANTNGRTAAPTEPTITREEWEAVKERARANGMAPAELLSKFQAAKPGEITKAKLAKANEHFAKLEAERAAAAPEEHETPIDEY